MFHKTAQIKHLASATYDAASESGFKRFASSDDGSSTETPSGYSPSYYVDGSRKIDIKSVLEKTASKFNISADPSDYIYEVIRANTTNVPNENHDGFHKNELLRYDAQKRCAVYYTYVGKPHHIQHATQNPRTARGVIVDAHYNDVSAPSETCPSCQFDTREASARDLSGIHCRRCGTVVKDEFVEILVAIDGKKDPLLASAIKRGELRAGSMGCNAMSTSCNVCDHVAYSIPEFCEHIRKGNKGTFWALSEGQERQGWRRVEAKALEGEFKRRGRKFIKDDFCFADVPGIEAQRVPSLRVRKAFEYCNQVEYDEYSRVDTPADPKALRIELLKAAALGEDAETSPAALKKETERLLIHAKQKKLKAELESLQHRAAALETEAAMPAEAEISADADIHVMTPEGDHMVAPDGSQVSVAPSGQEPPGEMQQAPGGPGAPGALPEQEGLPPGGAPGGIEGLTQDKVEPGQEDNQQWSPEALGILPPAAGARDTRSLGAAKMAGLFKKDYGEFHTEVTEEGNALLVSPAGPVMVVSAAKRLEDEASRIAFGKKVLGTLMSEGLLNTYLAYDGVFSPRFAQILDAAVTEMKDYKTRPVDPTTKDQEDEMAEGTRPKVSGLPKPILDGGVSELKKEWPEMPSGAIQDYNADNVIDRKTNWDKLNIIDEPRDEMAGDERLKKKLTDSFLDGGEEAQAEGHKAAAKKSTPSEEWLNMKDVSDSPAMKVWASRIQKSAALEIEKVKKEAAKEVADAEKRAAARFSRCLKVAAQRFALDLEDSPLKLAVYDTLHTKQEVGTDGLTIGPLSQELAVTLCQRAWKKGAAKEIISLLTRAGELMGYDDKYLADAEKDLSKQAISEPIIAKSASLILDEVQEVGATRRQEAAEGNLHLASTPEVRVDAEVSGKQAAIRDALRSRNNKVNGDLGILERAFNQSADVR